MLRARTLADAALSSGRAAEEKEGVARYLV